MISKINFNSPQHLSAILYGGTIIFKEKVCSGAFKTGPRTGEDKYQWVETSVTFRRLVEPLKRSELKSGGWSTNVTTLQSLSSKGTTREIIKLLLEYSSLEKLNSTYYSGIQKLSIKMGWTLGIVYGSYNQVVARTGRLSSAKPNLQNLSVEVDELVVTRFK